MTVYLSPLPVLFYDLDAVATPMAKRIDVPPAVQSLLEELEESPENVKTKTESHVIITQDNQCFELKPAECEKLLQSTSTVEKLFDALGTFNEASIELHGVEIECDVHDLLEELFDNVEE
jgi:hypothetical protein